MEGAKGWIRSNTNHKSSEFPVPKRLKVSTLIWKLLKYQVICGEFQHSLGILSIKDRIRFIPSHISFRINLIDDLKEFSDSLV